MVIDAGEQTLAHPKQDELVLTRRLLLALAGGVGAASLALPDGVSNVAAVTPVAIGPAVPFRIAVPEETLREIARRVRDTAWPAAPAGGGWEFGVDRTFLQNLAEHLVTGYDWRTQERAMNRFPHFRAEVAGAKLHFVHERGSGANPQPLVLLHGWPYSFVTFLPLIEQLAHPERFGGDAEDGFDVVVPSLPGFGFSEPAAAPIGPREIARRIDALMTDVLGYDRYLAQGGDWGAPIASWLAFDHTPRCQAIHLNSVGMGPAGPPFWVVDPGPDPLSAEERAAVAQAQTNFLLNMAHFFLQATRPLTVGYAASDSPIGAAAWLLDKWYLWADRRERSFAEMFTPDQLLTEAMIYLVTGTIATSFWIYSGFLAEKSWALPPGARIETPVGYASYPDPLGTTPREALEAVYNIVHWRDMPRGGHLPMAEVPELFLSGLLEFARLVR